MPPWKASLFVKFFLLPRTSTRTRSNAVNEIVFEEGFKGLVHLLGVVPDLVVLVALPAAQNDRTSGLDGVQQRAALTAGQGGGGRVGPGRKAQK